MWPEVILVFLLIVIAACVIFILNKKSRYGKGERKMGNGDKEINEKYKKYLKIRAIEDLANEDKNSYELRKIFEMYFIAVYPELKKVEVMDKLKDQLEEKGFPENMYEKFMKLLDKEYPIGKPKKKVIKGGEWVTIIYGKFKWGMPRYRYDILKRQGSDDDILECALEYARLMPGGQQWAIPLEEYKKFVKEGVTVEGFASPFNSQIVRVDPKLSYCSLAECDKQFGSLGNFFDQNFKGKSVIVNPPFVESLLEGAAMKCLEELEKYPCKFVFYGPEWGDSKFYTLLDGAKYKVDKEILKKFTYGYEDLIRGKKIEARFNSVVFTLERK